MSVSRSGTGGGAIDYDDLEVQTHRSVVKAVSDAADGDSTNDVNGFVQTGSYEPAGGLARGELAELVAVAYTWSFGMNAGGDSAFNVLQSMNGVVQWGALDAPVLTPIGPFEGLDPDGDATDEFEHDSSEETDAGLLLNLHDRVTFAYQNTTDGSGGGADAPHVENLRNFRNDLGLGQGPVFSRFDDLGTWMRIQVKGPMDSEGESSFQTHEFWNVYEGETERL